MIDFRLATTDDLDTLCAIAGDADYHARCLGERIVVIASARGRPVGYAMVNQKPRYSLYARLGIPEIQDLNVLRDERNQGIGGALVRHCEDMIRANGYEQVGICVGLHAGFGAAQRLYIRMGYLPDGYGVTYDRAPVKVGERLPVDDDLCLMMVKDL